MYLGGARELVRNAGYRGKHLAEGLLQSAQQVGTGEATGVRVEARQFMKFKCARADRYNLSVDIAGGKNVVGRVPNETYATRAAQEFPGHGYGIVENCSTQLTAVSKA